MSALYVPIMAAKRGEFTALSNLQGTMAKKLFPLFELPGKNPKTKDCEKSISKTAANAGKTWRGHSAFLDISKWSPNARTESGVHVLEYAFSQFSSMGIAVHPVVGYDRWDDPVYRQSLENICKNLVTPCIRFDREAVQDDMLDFSYFADRVNGILISLDLEPNNCFVMIDFGDVSISSVPDIIEDAEVAINTLQSIGFRTIIVAGGSMPNVVNKAVNTQDAEGFIPRIEMMAWKAIISNTKDKHIIFSDYLVRSPNATDRVIAPNANAKIRYTIENQYFILRGHSKKKHPLALQHKTLAEKLVASTFYMGPHFSWGDSELFYCSIGIKSIRDATLMIAIDSNHHIAYVVSEVSELRRKMVSTENYAERK